jgi:hypothetical protein
MSTGRFWSGSTRRLALVITPMMATITSTQKSMPNAMFHGAPKK